jgi:SAF domain
MTVSAKIPASRTGNATTAGNGGKPIAAPRVVNNRRVRTGGVLLGILLLVLGAALSGLALLSATRTSAYVAVAQQIPNGKQITAADLSTVELSGGQGLAAIPADQVNSVIGRYASTTLYPGALVVASELSNTTLVDSSQAEIGIHASTLPSSTLKPGDHVVLVSTGGAPGATAQTYPAVVVDLGTPASDGSVSMHVAVDPSAATAILSLGGNVQLYVAGH